jgi:hypothetical protein
LEAEGEVASEPALHLPAKAKLTWRISRLRLDASGRSWLATGLKGGRVAVIELPELSSPQHEEAWLAKIEASFEATKFDPLQADYGDNRG